MEHRTCDEPDCGRRSVNIGPFCGEHMRTRRYHEWRALTLEERFWARVDRTAGPDGCWEWFGAKVAYGYGMMTLAGGKGVGAHAYSYELAKGPIPDGLEIDHLCCNTSCVNPAHLEAVTAAENMRRRSERYVECKQGHDLTDPANVTWHKRSGRPDEKVCKPCALERVRNHRRRRGLHLRCDDVA